MNVLIQLGMRIRYLRKEKKMSQLDLSLESGINRNYLSDLEKGRRNPSLLVLEKLCNVLGVSLSTLFKGIESFN